MGRIPSSWWPNCQKYPDRPSSFFNSGVPHIPRCPTPPLLRSPLRIARVINMPTEEGGNLASSLIGGALHFAITIHPSFGKETEPRNIPLTEHRRQGWQKLDMYMMSERRHLFSGTIDISLDSRLTVPRFFLGNATASKVDFEPNLSSVTHVRSWCARLTLPRIFQAKFQCHMSYWMHLSVVKPSVRKKLVMVALAIWNM